MVSRLFYLPELGGSVLLAAPKSNQVKTYKVVVKRVIDGDTFVADLHVGYGGLVVADRRMRLAGGNAREHNKLGGPEAAANLGQLLPVGALVTVQVVSETADPHGRLLVTVTLDDGTDLIGMLIEQQWLVPWDGRGPAPLPPWPRTVP